MCQLPSARVVLERDDRAVGRPHRSGRLERPWRDAGGRAAGEGNDPQRALRGEGDALAVGRRRRRHVGAFVELDGDVLGRTGQRVQLRDVRRVVVVAPPPQPAASKAAAATATHVGRHPLAGGESARLARLDRLGWSWSENASRERPASMRVAELGACRLHVVRSPDGWRRMKRCRGQVRVALDVANHGHHARRTAQRLAGIRCAHLGADQVVSSAFRFG